jgi:6-phosphogluconolactonase
MLALAAALAMPAAASAVRVVYVPNATPPTSVSALAINANGSLTPLSGSPFASPFPAQNDIDGVTITPDAQHLYIAMPFGQGGMTPDSRIGNYDVSTNGSLTPVPGQASFVTGGTNALDAAPSPDNRFIYAIIHTSGQLGVLTVNANGSLGQVTPGSPFSIPATQQNPFPVIPSPDGDNLYVPNENSTETVAGCGGTCEVNRVTSYSVANDGALAPLQGTGVITGTTNVNPSGPNPFGAGITPDGRFLYVSNPEDGANGKISGFAVNANGTLSNQLFTPLNVSPGNHPLMMAVSPDSQHLYVAERVSGTIGAYTINNDGTLTAVPGQPFAATGGTQTRGVALTPDGSRLYTANSGTSNISGFNVAANGALTPTPSSPYATGGAGPNLESIAITPNQPPVAAFSPTTLAPAGQPSTFNANASTDDDAVARYDWDFGDGSTLPNGGPTPQHTYANPGTYTVKLTLTDDESCSTERIFNGEAMLCNGSPVASISQQITIQPQQQGQQGQCVVPNLKKKKKKKAAKKLAAANCSLGKVKKKHSSKVKKGKIIKQKPPAGTILPPGSPVKIKVSSGPD